VLENLDAAVFITGLARRGDFAFPAARCSPAPRADLFRGTTWRF
jgi:hypothetical protein